MSNKIRHITVIRLSAMGDVAMTVPVLRAFSKTYPDVRITMVSKPFFKPFFDGIPNVSFFAADVTGRHKGLKGIFTLFSDLREMNVDAIADFHNVLRSKIIRRLFAMTGKATAATDKARSEKKALTRADNKVFQHLMPMTQRHAKTFEQLGFPIDLSNPEFPPKPTFSPEILEITGEKSQPWIGIAPFAQHQSKVYSEDLMAEVITALSIKGNRIFLFGAGKTETAILEKYSAGDPNIVVVAGKMTFDNELKLIANLDLMISMDSGNAHIAAMYGVKTITLWGATHPFAGFAPFNQPLENALVSDREKFPKLPTSIYGNKKVEGYEDAMRTISPETVVAAALSALS